LTLANLKVDCKHAVAKLARRSAVIVPRRLRLPLAAASRGVPENATTIANREKSAKTIRGQDLSVARQASGHFSNPAALGALAELVVTGVFRSCVFGRLEQIENRLCCSGSFASSFSKAVAKTLREFGIEASARRPYRIRERAKSTTPH